MKRRRVAAGFNACALADRDLAAFDPPPGALDGLPPTSRNIVRRTRAAAFALGLVERLESPARTDDVQAVAATPDGGRAILAVLAGLPLRAVALLVEALDGPDEPAREPAHADVDRRRRLALLLTR